MPYRIIKIATRWEAKQVGPKDIEIHVPTGPEGTPPLNPEFIEDMGLSAAEIADTEETVLRSLAVLR